MTRIRKPLREEHKNAIKWAWRKFDYKYWREFWSFPDSEFIPPLFSKDNYMKYKKEIIAFYKTVNWEWRNDPHL